MHPLPNSISPPPPVYACCALGLHSIPSFSHTFARPMLYANLSDIPWMTAQSNYVACVTETVFELKTDLFDALISKDDKVLQVIEEIEEDGVEER